MLPSFQLVDAAIIVAVIRVFEPIIAIAYAPHFKLIKFAGIFTAIKRKLMLVIICTGKNIRLNNIILKILLLSWDINCWLIQ